MEVAVKTEYFQKDSALSTAPIQVATRTNTGSTNPGDTANFSSESLDALKGQRGKDSMTSTTVSTTLVDGNDTTKIVFNNKTGAVTWNNSTLNLSGFANTLKDDVVIKNNNGMIDVYNLTTGKVLTLNADGSKQTIDGKKFDESSIREEEPNSADLSVALFINNRGKAATSGDNNDVIINREAGANIDAGGGDDKIFNFAATADSLDGGGGNDSVYTVGLNSGTNIDVSNGNGYVKLLGNMSGGTINLGSGTNLVDASGRTLAVVTIDDDTSAVSSAVIAGSVTKDSSITLNAAQAALDTKLISHSSVNFGTGSNSLVADRIAGLNASNKSVITSQGTNTYNIGTTTHTDFDSSGAISDAIKINGNVADSDFKLSKGTNLLDATGRTLTGVNISSEDGGTTASKTTINAAAISGRNAQNGVVSVTLAGSGGNEVNVSGSIRNAIIDAGVGANTVNAGSVSNVELTMGGSGSTQAQNLTVNGKTDKLTYTGSGGTDTVNFKGAVSNSSIDLGAGNNALSTRNAKGVNQGVVNTNITASGQGNTSLVLGNYTYGVNGNLIDLGEGNNSIITGTITGKGTTGLTIDAEDSISQSLDVAGNINRLTYKGSAGNDTLAVSGAISNSDLNLGEGDNSVTARNVKGQNTSVTNTNITASGSGSTTLIMGNYTYGADGNIISLSTGSNSVTIGRITGKGTTGLSIDTNGTDQDQTLIINGAVNRLTYNGSQGKDTITTAGAISNSQINLGDGLNTLTAQNSRGVNQAVVNTNITATGDSTTSLTMGVYTYGVDGNKIELGSGSNSITVGTIKGRGTSGLTIDVSNSAEDQLLIINGSASRLNYKGSSGKDEVTVNGSLLVSDIDLGEGDNIFNATKSRTIVRDTTITATGFGNNEVSINNLTISKYGTSSLKLGDGNDTVTIRSLSGKRTTVDMGEGALDTFTSTNVSGATVKGKGGTYNLTSARNMHLDFTGGTDIVNLNIQKTLSGSIVDLGDGETFIASNIGATEGDSTTVLSGTRINAGNSKLNIDAKSIVSSTIDMNSTNAGSDSLLNLNVGSLNKSKVELGAGDTTLNAKTITSSTITRTEAGSLLLNSGNVSKSVFTLTGEGNDTLRINGNMNANIQFGEAGDADVIDVTGTLSGSLKSGTSIDIQAGRISALTGNIKGDTTIRTDAMANSNLTMGEGINSITKLTEPEDSNEVSKLIISGSKLYSGGLLDINAKNITSSSITMYTKQEDGTASLNMALSGVLQKTTVNMIAGTNSITVDSMSGSTINRDGEGDLTFTAESVASGNLNLTGKGSDTITVANDMNANLKLGEGADTVSVGGIISGTVQATDDVTITAQKMNNMTAALAGANNRLDIAESFENSHLEFGDGTNDIGNDGVTYTNTQIIAGNGNTTITGSTYDLGYIVAGNGDNTINIKDRLYTEIALGEGNNTIGTETTSLAGMYFESTGSNIIKGVDLVNAELHFGVEGKTNQVLIDGLMQGTKINLYGGNNTIDGKNVDMINTEISGTGSGANTVQVKSMTGGSIKLGESNDTIDIYGNIVDAEIDLGEGLNSLRNTLATDQIGQTVAGQGTALTNQVKNSTIKLDGKSNVYLGQATGGTQIEASGTNNINISELKDSTLDASTMEAGSINAGTVNGDITAGRGGTINVDRLEKGTLTDEQGQNTITVGTLGELGTIKTGDPIHSTLIHINQLDGSVTLGNANYGGAKQGNLTIADPAYAGSVSIAGTVTPGAGTSASTIDTSGFGKGQGTPVS